MARKKKQLPYRAIALKGLDKELEISKATLIRKTKKQFIHFDELDDGTWRVVWTEGTIPDFKDVQALEVLRND